MTEHENTDELTLPEEDYLLMRQHVTGEDHELHFLDCFLSDILGKNEEADA